jgi:hypothetical protein
MKNNRGNAWVNRLVIVLKKIINPVKKEILISCLNFLFILYAHNLAEIDILTNIKYYFNYIS